MTPAGIEPATFRFVAQHLNHWATAVSVLWLLNNNNNDMCALQTKGTVKDIWRETFTHLWENSHTLRNKYEGPKFYLCYPLYTKMKLITFTHLWENSHTLRNKYEGPKFYLCYPLYTKMKLITFLNERGEIWCLRPEGHIITHVRESVRII